ncbi:MAG: exo-alpha-sialidase [archaeon]|nr:exo-alpha-sialidase [archaeon]
MNKSRLAFLFALLLLTMSVTPIAIQASTPLSTEDKPRPFSGLVESYFEDKDIAATLGMMSVDVRVWKSSDGGLTFSPSVVVVNGSRSFFNDATFIAVDAFPDSPYSGNVYVSWTRFSFEADKVYTQIFLSRSTDGGETWSEPISISPKFDIEERLVQGSMPAVGPDGTVYLAYYDSLDDGPLSGDFSPMIAKSTNGGASFSSPEAITTEQEMDYDMPPTEFRAWASMFPRIAVDPFDSDYVYAVYTIYDPFYREDVYFSRSDDGGETWDSPLYVNDDETSNSQFFPSITVTPDRRIHIIWGDRRDDPDNYLYNIYYDNVPFTGPFNPGLGTDEKISTKSSDPTIQDPYYIGDYFDIAPTDDDEIFAVWTDMRNDGDQDIYIAGSPDFDNIRVNQDPITRLGFSIQDGPTIAINPIDPENIVVGAYDLRNPFLYGYIWYYASIDGGETWIEGPLPGAESFAMISDPSLAFGLDNITYFATIATEPVDLTISPDSGPVGTSVNLKATGFDPFSTIWIMFDDEDIGSAVTDALGTAELMIQVPNTQTATHTIKVTDGIVWARESFTVISPILIDIQAGSNLFRGETARFYAITMLNGQQIDVTTIAAHLYFPTGSTTTLTVQRIGTGLYRADYKISSNAPFGTYLVTFDAELSDTVQAAGSSTSSFIVSQTLSDSLSLITALQFIIIALVLIEGLIIIYILRKCSI